MPQKCFHLTLLLVFALALASCATSDVPEYEGPQSAHFDGTHFHNPWMSEVPQARRSSGFLGFVWRWLTAPSREPWPDWVDQPLGEKPPARVTKGLRITFVGHATLLVQTAGLNILTDPVWSHHVGPTRLVSVERYKNPGIHFDDLPEIDAIVISHNHYDHMDVRTLRRIHYRSGAKKPVILVPLGNSALLRKFKLGATHDLDWWQSFELKNGVKVTAVPAQHWSTRYLHDRNRALWAGYVIHTPAGPIYFAGDTGYGAFVQEIRKRMGPVKYALLPIGAYIPEWFQRHHISPKDAVRIHAELGAQVSIPMHYATFRQSLESYERPVADLKAALAESKLQESAFKVLREGGFLEVNP